MVRGNSCLALLIPTFTVFAELLLSPFPWQLAQEQEVVSVLPYIQSCPMTFVQLPPGHWLGCLHLEESFAVLP